MRKPGDIVLLEAKGFLANIVVLGNIWTRLFNSSHEVKYAHVGMMVNEFDIIEALSTGITTRVFPYKSGYKIVRFNVIDDEIRESIAKDALAMSGTKYSWWLNIVLGFLKITRLEIFFKGIGHKGQNCSRAVAMWHHGRTGYQFGERGLDLVDPADIARAALVDHTRFWDVIEEA